MRNIVTVYCKGLAKKCPSTVLLLCK